MHSAYARYIGIIDFFFKILDGVELSSPDNLPNTIRNKLNSDEINFVKNNIFLTKYFVEHNFLRIK